MRHLTQVLLAMFWKFGGLGLVVLGILDSSFLFAPLGNDLLVVAMTARKHSGNAKIVCTRFCRYAPPGYRR